MGAKIITNVPSVLVVDKIDFANSWQLSDGSEKPR